MMEWVGLSRQSSEDGTRAMMKECLDHDRGVASVPFLHRKRDTKKSK